MKNYHVKQQNTQQGSATPIVPECHLGGRWQLRASSEASGTHWGIGWGSYVAKRADTGNKNKTNGRENKKIQSDGESMKTRKLFRNNYILSCQFLPHKHETTILNVHQPAILKNSF